jgi:hypothetical protein
MSPDAAGALGDPAYPLPRPKLAILARTSYGLALICCPGRLIALRTGEWPDRRVRVVGRVLGLRHLAQALAGAACPIRLIVGAGVAADVAHAASMLILAGRDPDLRSALLTDAAIAAALAAAGAAMLRGGRPHA